MNSEKDIPTLVYGFDPLCGWCFAFRGALRTLRREFAGRLRWEVACGGLVTGERVRPIGETREYLLRGEQMLMERAGVSFGRGFREGLLAEGTWTGGSQAPCRAVLAAQALFGADAALDLGDELIRGFYEDGVPPDSAENLRQVAGRLRLDADLLLERWERDRASADRQMQEYRDAGVRMYPSLFSRGTDGLREIYSGFASAEELRPLIRRHLE